MKALVLSGGGTFGAYQIGAWLRLQEMGWRPDLVVGTSIGAVNGFAISRGCRPEELLRFWQHLPGAIEAQGAGQSWLPVWGQTGVFRKWLSEIYRAAGTREPICQLHVVMTEIPGFRLRAVEGRRIREKHLLASTALPGVLPPVRVDNGIYIDGGSICHLPLRNAILSGASEILTVDVLAVHPFPSIRRAREAITRIRHWLRMESAYPTPEELSKVDVRRIESPQRLGTLRACFEWDRSFVEELIEAGRRDASSAMAARPAA